jgi:enterochelin esterase-like enzyme
VNALLTNLKRAYSRNVSLVAGVLIVLLLLDAGFVLVRTALPAADTSARQSVAAPAESTLARVADEAGDAALLAPAGAPNSALAESDSVVLAQARQPASLPRTRFEEPVAEAELSNWAAQQPSACPSASGSVVTETVPSKVLGIALPVHVYLPPCYDPEHSEYPSLYLMRGTDGYGNWVKMGLPEVAEVQIGVGMLPPFIAVMPATDEWTRNGGKFRFSDGGRNSWEAFMVDELMPFIDARYSTWRSRDGRAIGGISRGAYWSIEIAFKHPDLFGAVGGHSPSITPDMLIGVPYNFSMVSLAATPEDVQSLRIALDAGGNDWAQKGVNRLSADLDALNIPYTATSGDGIHDDRYWTSRIGDYLAFYTANWPRQPRARSALVGYAGDIAPDQP